MQLSPNGMLAVGQDRLLGGERAGLGSIIAGAWARTTWQLRIRQVGRTFRVRNTLVTGAAFIVGQTAGRTVYAMSISFRILLAATPRLKTLVAGIANGELTPLTRTWHMRFLANIESMLPFKQGIQKTDLPDFLHALQLATMKYLDLPIKDHPYSLAFPVWGDAGFFRSVPEIVRFLSH
jgi:hypothetical protein